MAYGGNSGGKVLFFTFENSRKDDDQAYISIYDRNAGEKGETVGQCNYVEGDLVGIKFGEGSYENDKYKTVVLTLKDNETNTYYKVKCRFDKMTLLMRGVLNRLLTATSMEQVKISYFGNKGEYKNVSVKSHGEKLEYMFSQDTLKPYIFPITDRQGVVLKNDYTDLDKFLMEQVEAMIIPQLPKQTEKQESSHTESKPSTKGSEDNHGDPGSPIDDFPVPPTDDLPF